MTPAERRIIAYTSAAHSLIHILEWTYAALLLKISLEFDIGFFLLGALGNVFAYTFGFGALPSGLLTDRLGSPRVLYICLLGTSLSAVLVAVSQTSVMLGIALALKQGCLNNGVDLMGFNGGLVSAVHQPTDIDSTIEAFDKTVAQMQEEGIL